MSESGQMIRVLGLGKTYRRGQVAVSALAGVTLDIPRGDFVAITGRNGAGKSTLMHCLAVLDSPDEGQIVIDGLDVTRLTRRQRIELRLEKLGYVFQEHALIAELTALENVMLPALVLHPTKEARKRAELLLARVELTRYANHLPSELSGGEQQRVAIARALVNAPIILYADEPTARLDSVAARGVMGIFANLNREGGHTIVMVTHEDDEARSARRVVRLADGRVADDRRLS